MTAQRARARTACTMLLDVVVRPYDGAFLVIMRMCNLVRSRASHPAIHLIVDVTKLVRFVGALTTPRLQPTQGGGADLRTARMPQTPLRPTRKAALNNTPSEPWSKTPSRFSGPGSYLIKLEGQSPTGTTPQNGHPTRSASSRRVKGHGRLRQNQTSEGICVFASATNR